MQNHLKIKKYLKDNKIKNLTINQIALALNISPSSITRYAKIEGFLGFKELKFYLSQKNNEQLKTKENITYLNIITSLSNSHEQLEINKLNFMAKQIIKLKKAIFLGTEFTYFVALYFANLFCKINIKAKAINAGSNLSSIIGDTNKVFILIINNENFKYMHKVAKKIKTSGGEKQILFSINSFQNKFDNSLYNEVIYGHSFYEEKNLEIEFPFITSLVIYFITYQLFINVYQKLKNS